MNLYDELMDRKEKLAVVGLGYVGLPLAVAFARKLDVIGFDTSSAKIELYNQGIDPTKEVGNEAIKSTTMYFTDDEKKLKEAKFFVAAVPTPVRKDTTPDLRRQL